MDRNAHTLSQMADDLQACQRGDLGLTALTARWREAVSALPLPPRYAQVLGDVLDRLEAGALFSEESCSFSQSGLLGQLQPWLDQARAQLTRQAS